MATYIARRILLFIPLLLIVSVISFTIIQLPSGDYVTRYISQLKAEGLEVADVETVAVQLRQQYALDKPVYMQYFVWIYRILRYGDFGKSFTWDKPVAEVLGERMGITIVISLCSLLFVYAASIPIGIYSAVHQYSLSDHIFTFFGFVGLATPNFLLALLFLFLAFKGFGISLAGLFSPQYAQASWSLAKIVDMIKHLWIPVIVIGTAGTAQLIRVMRAGLLDELRKQYVITARAKGVSERRLLFKYPVRVALNPILSSIGWTLPAIISGATVTSIVLNLPSVGPTLLYATMGQDIYLAGGGVLMLSSLAIMGSLFSDILLSLMDPRIRYERRST